MAEVSFRKKLTTMKIYTVSTVIMGLLFGTWTSLNLPESNVLGAGVQQADESETSLFEGMGGHKRPIATSAEATQKFFDQGLTWAYGFNHDEAIRSFLVAGRKDPGCPMPWWGIAYCEGPNYNSPITPERSKAAWYAMQNALARIDKASDRERSLIEALATRYAMPAPQDRGELDRAYADAMERVWKRYPADADIGTWYAESLMMLRPWKLYTTEGVPEDDTENIVETLEAVLKLQPDHPGANHPVRARDGTQQHTAAGHSGRQCTGRSGAGQRTPAPYAFPYLRSYGTLGQGGRAEPKGDCGRQ